MGTRVSKLRDDGKNKKNGEGNKNTKSNGGGNITDY